MTIANGEVERRVTELVREQLGFPEGAPVGPDDDFFQALGGDSLDYAELAMEIEDRLGVDLPDDEEPRTLRALVARVEQALATASAKGERA